MTEIRKRTQIRRQLSDEDSLQPSDTEESSGEYDTPGGPASTNTNMARPSRRSAGNANGTTSATISRSTSGSPEDRRQSIRLTVKAPPSKLREVMRVNEVDALKDVIGGGQIVEGPRRSRNVPPPRVSGRRPDKPRYAESESDLEDDDEEDEDDEEQDEDDEADEDEPMPDAEADSDQDEEDEDQDIEDEHSPPERSAPPPKVPKITLKQPNITNGQNPSNPKLIVTPAQAGPVKSVEEQEMDDDDEDDEEDGSSELSEDEDEDDEEEDEDDDQEETMQLDAGAEQGAGDELGDDEELDEEDEDLDSDEETLGSGTATPDITKLTKRQRGRPEDSTELMALDMAPQQRKFFTDHEKAMKKDEHARKRKELTKRKVQEEKAAALNRLLKPQASKARGAAPKPETLAAAAAAATGSPYEEEEYQDKANPLYTRWVNTKDGFKLGVPEEWLGKRVGRVFGPPLPPSNGTLVQEL